MDRLLSLIPRTIGFGETAFDGALITNARQAAALARAAERCEAALYAAQCGMTPDAVVMDAEGAIAALGEITRRDRDRVGRYPNFQRFLRRQVTRRTNVETMWIGGPPAARSGPFQAIIQQSVIER